MFHRINIEIENVLNYVRSFFFNLKIFPFSTAVRCPILLHYNTETYISKNARVRIATNGGGKILIGIHPGSYALSNRKTRFCVYDDSEVVFKGGCNISRGTNITVRYGGRLSIGNNFFCNADCNILVNKEVTFDDDVLLGWDVTILDSDGHPTTSDGIQNSMEKSIYIGQHSWLGAKSTILKGVSLVNDTIVPYGITIHKSNTMPNTVFTNKTAKTNIARND